MKYLILPFLLLLSGLTACKKGKIAKAGFNGIYTGSVQEFDLSDSSQLVLSDSFLLELRKAGAFKYEIISPDESILPSMVFKSQGATREGVIFALNPKDESWYLFIDYTRDEQTGLAVGKTGVFEGVSYPSLLFEGWR